MMKLPAEYPPLGHFESTVAVLAKPHERYRPIFFAEGWYMCQKALIAATATTDVAEKVILPRHCPSYPDYLAVFSRLAASTLDTSTTVAHITLIQEGWKGCRAMFQTDNWLKPDRPSGWKVTSPRHCQSSSIPWFPTPSNS